MQCPFYTKQKSKKKSPICMRYSSPYYKKECPFTGVLEDCREGGGSKEPELVLPFE